ncbi:hypothetical protein CFHF_19760 [Caulobacter flavus]|uniref:AprE-like beta-barrel domain-containing protein n=1 Tax=Caulobacter flavus TaxID=1679497 RepID=A0A2N5CP14_9CAUL|nr:HlyD family efflux transporter periplasmic adaptor subunit [Caulobacter flavus]AYV48592.1 hypothetical protein C1707_21305 [Caulobacter flavus]PLR08692.1 hypothetical protein CFHF_19760 [Caulobacter flavus]
MYEERSIEALLRPEALQANRDKVGAPVFIHHVPGWIITLLLLSILVASSTFLCLATYARRETVSGLLQPTAGAFRATSLKAGTVTRVPVRDGQNVDVGTPLLSVQSDATLGGGGALSEALALAAEGQRLALLDQAQARRAVLTEQQQGIALRRAAMMLDQKRLLSDRRLQVERMDLAEKNAAAAKSLWEKELMSSLALRQRQEALIVAKQELSAIDRRIEAIPTSLAQLENEARQIGAEQGGQAAAIVANLALLDEKSATTRADALIDIVSPISGKVAALRVKPGEAVAPGEALTFVIPHGGRLQAELWAPSRAAGFIREGDKVRLMYDAFPYQRFGVSRGRVKSIAGAATAPGDVPTVIQAQEAMFRIVVELDQQDVRGYGKNWPLSPGMKLSADLVLEQQSLFAWLFDKLRAARQRSAPL